jgi:hypothetical protein
MKYWYDTSLPCQLLWRPLLVCGGGGHSLQSLTFERLGHCAVVVGDGVATVEEFPGRLLPEIDVGIELVEVMSPEEAASVGVGVWPWTKTISCKSSQRAWMLIIGIQEGSWRVRSQDAWCFDHLVPGVSL